MTNFARHPVAPQVKMAQAPLPSGADHSVVQQEQWLRQEALQVRACESCFCLQLEQASQSSWLGSRRCRGPTNLCSCALAWRGGGA